MTEHKYTDEEVIKALECCIKAETWGDCDRLGCPALCKQGCYFYLRTDNDAENTVYNELIKEALELINRQRAEIERLNILVNEAKTQRAKKFVPQEYVQLTIDEMESEA